MPPLRPDPTRVLPSALGEDRRRIVRLERRVHAAPSTTLPSNPFVGQRWVVPHATGVWEVTWTGSAWVYTGGNDLVGYTAAETTTASNAYPGSPQGPSVTLPRGGTFDVWMEARHRHSHTGALFTAMRLMSGATPVGAEIAPVIVAGAQLVQGAWVSVDTGLSLAAGSHGMGFRAPNGGGINTHYAWRLLRVRPRTLT
jgi:hypothetical protein